jgi:imidazolonepropionase-like amidohydrolase
MAHIAVAGCLLAQLGYDTSFHTPAWTVRRGAMLVLKSDHPVTDAKGLMYAAARAVHYGLSVEDALRSMTINAAITLGLRAAGDAVGHPLGADVPTSET